MAPRKVGDILLYLGCAVMLLVTRSIYDDGCQATYEDWARDAPVSMMPTAYTKATKPSSVAPAAPLAEAMADPFKALMPNSQFRG